MLASLLGPVSGLLNKIVPDANERARLAHEIATMADKYAHELAVAQIEVNRAEAASDSVFKGGWRPFIGWTCGAAFAYHFVLQPVCIFVLVYNGHEVPSMPAFDMASLMTVLMGMLGLGGLRTFEKFKGCDKK